MMSAAGEDARRKNFCILQSHDKRWSRIAEQAGNHSQEDTVLRISRCVSPLAFLSGVPPSVVSRIQTLHICIANDLPEWLDILVGRFCNLKGLFIYPTLNGADENRMRRLYILYRLPDLLVMDGIAVTRAERQLARPETPNGHRVARNEWLPIRGESLLSSDDDDSDTSDCDGVEVTLSRGILKFEVTDHPKPEHRDEARVDESTHKDTGTVHNRTVSSPSLTPCEHEESVGKLRQFAQLHSLCARSDKYLSEETSVAIQIERNLSIDFDKQSRQSKNRLFQDDEDFGLCLGDLDLPSGVALVSPRGLCTKEEKYLADEESDITYEIKNPHQAATSKEKTTPNIVAKGKENILRGRPRTRNTRRSRSLSMTPTYHDNRATSLPLPSKSSRQVMPLHSPPRLSPSRSLSSPFPIQFRVRQCDMVTEKKQKPLPKIIPPPPITRKEFAMETIDSPILLPPPTRVRQKVVRRGRRQDRPPPCPTRRPAPVPETRHRRIRGTLKRRPGRWKTLIPSTSVLDDDDDDDEEDDSSENGEDEMPE